MSDSGRAHAEHPPHGSIGEEAAKLAEALQGWLGQRTGRAAGDVWAAATAADESFDSPECRLCPICRGMRFFSSLRPEVFEHLSEAAASFGAALRAMSEDAVSHVAHDGPDGMGSGEPSGEA